MFDHNAQALGREASKPKDVGQTLAKLGQYFAPYKLALLFVALLIVAGTYMQVLIPDLVGQAVDCYLGPVVAQEALSGGGIDLDLLQQFAGEQGADGGIPTNCWFADVAPTATTAQLLRGLGGLILLMAGLFVANAFVSGITFYLMSWAGQHLLRDLRADIFRQIHRLTMGYFDRHESGDIMSRLINDTDTINQIISFGLIQVAQGSLLIVWIIARMVSKSAPYAGISLVTLPLMIVATRWFSQKARQAFRQARREIGEVNADLQESISSVREVQAFNREDENIAQFRESNAANRDANIRAQAYSSALGPTLEALSYVSMAIVAGVGGYVILGDGLLLGTTISLGLIITFIGYTQQFNVPVQQIAVMWTNIQSAVAGSERIFEFLETQPDIEERPGAQPIPQVKGHVVFEDVWAEYNEDEPVLEGISLEARPGETVAIVGPTGAGKTTIINLIPRFYDVTQGAVRIDGYDVRDVTRRNLREQIGLVLQDTFLFSDTVLNNIRYGRPETSEEEVIAAAKLAHAHDFIERLPDGYQTVLGERGAGLSQGQRQLLAIARVTLGDPRILILDEATSSVDTRTERAIQKALDELLAERTSFVIAHRLSTIRNADQVLVLDAGKIVERGTHQSLLEARGFYYNLYQSQFRRQNTAAPDGTGAFFVPAD
ncbi:MAG: ABC transporter ATP-binding protein [Chloroflexi bacterium]|nr:ABC transporter ATP-binding protein [Chloroflexota bacterium]